MNIDATANGSLGGPPVVNQALEPAWVRNGSPAIQKSYETAVAFEETLVEQLSKTLTASGGIGNESIGGETSGEGEPSSTEGSSPAAAGSVLSSLVPQALTESVMSAGGLGLAAQLTNRPPDTQRTGETGGVASPESER